MGADYHFPDLHLTPGIKIGIQQPATYTLENLDVGGAIFSGKRTVVIHSTSNRSILPVNEGARMIYSVKANVKWDISEALAFVGELYYTWDDNQVIFVNDFFGLNAYEFTDAHILGLNLAAQARF